MMRSSLLFLGGMLLASAPAAALAQITIGEERVPAFEKLVEGAEVTFGQLPASPGDAGTLLINGTPVDPAFFPGVLRMTTGGTCTASMVGPASVLLAAHCVRHNSLVQFKFGTGSVRGICEQAFAYNTGDKSADWALCLLEHPVSGLVYETIDITNIPAEGDRIFLTGYGCTMRGGALDGVLRIGSAPVGRRHAALPIETSTIYTVGSIVEGDAVLCPGDSGGPAFVLAGNDASVARAIVGVNSRTTFEFGISLFSATASPLGKAFIEGWAEQREQSICGVNLDDGCR